jgi:hypothetical protein
MCTFFPRSRVSLVHLFAPEVVFPPVTSYGHQVRIMDLVTYFRIRTSLDFSRDSCQHWFLIRLLLARASHNASDLVWYTCVYESK